MIDQAELQRLQVKARLLDELSDALGRYAEARATRSAEAQRLWLDLLAVMDRADATVSESAAGNTADEQRHEEHIKEYQRTERVLRAKGLLT